MKTVIANNIRMIKEVKRYSPAYYWMSMAVVLLTSAEDLLKGPILLKFVFDNLPNEHGFLRILVFLTAVFALVALNTYVRSTVNNLYRPEAERRVAQHMQTELMKKTGSIDYLRYADSEYYRQFIWALRECESRVMAVFDSCLNLITNILTFVIYAYVVFSIDFMIFVIAVVHFGVNLLTNALNGKYSYKAQVDLRPVETECFYYRRLFYLGEYAKDMRIGKWNKMFLGKYQARADEAKRIRRQYGKKLFAVNAVSDIITYSILMNIVNYGYLGYKLLVLRVLSIGDVTALISSSERITGLLRNFAISMPEFYKHSLFIDKYLDFMKTQPNIEIAEGIEWPSDFKLLECNNVSFRYPNTRVNALNRICLSIARNEKIAIVGYNGSGKSTLVHLPIRLFDPAEGMITLNNTDIRDYNIQQYRRGFAAALQNFNLYAVTIEQNIAMNSEVDAEKLGDSFSKSGLGKVIEKLPLKEKSVLTKEFDNDGVSFSGGENQKLGIARVIYRNAEVIILDEPSSALDPLSEYEFNSTIAQLAHDKTVIYISHNLSSTRMADYIYVMEDGSIVESGTHDELMRKNGKYAELFRIQERYYTDSECRT